MEPNLPPARRPPGSDGRRLLSNSNEFFALHEKFRDDAATKAAPAKPRPPVKPPSRGSGGPVVAPGEPAGARGGPSASPSSTASRDREHTSAGPDPHPSSGVVGGRAFLDADLNGAYDDGVDEGVAGVAARLYSCDGAPVGEVRATSPEGWFRWDGLPWGHYIVVLESPDGYAASTTLRGRGGDVFELTEGSSGSAPSTGGTVCFAIREGGPRRVELSFAMALRSEPPPVVAAVRPPPTPSPRPTDGPSFGGTTPSPPPTSDRPHPPTTGDRPHPPPSSDGSPPPPTGPGEIVGPVRSDGLRITLFGIEGVRDEGEMNDGMARYINRYFDSGEDYAFDVDVDIRITKQTTKLDALGNYLSNHADGSHRMLRARRLQGQPSVEIAYDQISTYRTIDPTFVDISYILQEPFATTESRRNYVAFLRRLSPTNFANVSSVSPVRLPPRREAPTYEGANKSGSGPNVGLLVGVPLVLLSAMLLVCIFCKGRRKTRRGGKEAPAPTEAKGEASEETKEGLNKSESFSNLFNKSDSFSNLFQRSDSFPNLFQSAASLLHLRMQPATRSATTDASATDASSTGASATGASATSATYRTQASDATWATPASAIRSYNPDRSEEELIEVSLPPGRVGCVIDSSPERGPYVCEVQEGSRVRGIVLVGDRIVAVDGESVEDLNAVAVSRLLGSRSENEERRVTILRGFVSYDDVFEESEPSDSDCGGDDKSLDIEDDGEESMGEESMEEESSKEENSREERYKSLNIDDIEEESVNEESLKEENSREEPSREESLREESSREEGYKSLDIEDIGEGSVKEESLKEESLREEPSREESSREEHRKSLDIGDIEKGSVGEESSGEESSREDIT